MFNKPHRLKKNKSSFFPQEIIFLDTETYNSTPNLDNELHLLKYGFAQFVSYRNLKSNKRTPTNFEFTDNNKFHQFVLEHARKRRKLNILASNVWFDIRVTGIDLFLMQQGWRNTRIYQNGLITIINFKLDDFHIQFLSLQNFIPFSIKAIGKLINLPKLEVEFDEVSFDELKIYCKRDTEILRLGFEYWIKLCKESDFGNFGVTLPSQAFNAYRHKYMEHAIFIHDDPETIELERKSYFGGRTECFYIGEIHHQNTYKLDVNSLYPHVMQQNFFPTKLINKIINPSAKMLEEILRNYCVIADCDISIDKSFVAYRHKQHTLFPTGNIRGCFCTGTLQRLISKGSINKIHTAAVYLQSKLFKSYVTDLNDKKIQAGIDNDFIKRSIYKLFLNSLYGKFGQRKKREKYSFKTELDFTRNEIVYHKPDEMRYHVLAYGGKETWFEQTQENSFNAFVAIASHVTDYARLHLLDAMEIVQAGNYFYCDTDSLFVNLQGYQNILPFIHDNELGKWKVEGVTDYCKIRNPKDYTFGSEVKLKGISKNAKQLGEDLYQQAYFPTFKTSLRDGIVEGFVIKSVTKKIKGIYLKATVGLDGWTIPFVF